MKPVIFNATDLHTERPVSCDNCERGHHRCDRKVPICSRCLRLKKNCTRDRPLKIKQRPFYESCNPFIVKVSNKNLAINKKTSSQVQDNQLQKCSPPSTSSSIDNFKPTSFSQVFQKWAEDSKSRFELFYFARISGLFLKYATFEDKIFLSHFLTKVSPLIVSKKSSQVNLKNFHRNSIAVKQMLDLSEKAYFHYFNPFLALFTLQQFRSRPRSYLLKLAIWRTGLQVFEPSGLKTQILLFLDENILLLTRLSVLPTRLETIQALLILTNGVFEPPVYYKLRSFYHISTIMIFNLGLHRPKSSFRNIEVQLLLNFLTLIDHKNFYRSSDYTLLPLRDGFTSFHPVKYKSNRFFLKQCCFSNASVLYSSYTNYLITRIPPQIPYKLKVENIPDTINCALDSGILISSTCFAAFVNILKHLNSKFTSFRSESISSKTFYGHIKEDWRNLDTIFLNGFTHLDSIKAIKTTEGHVFSKLLYDKPSSLFQTFNCPFNLSLSQLQHVLSLRFHYSRLYILDYAFHTSSRANNYLLNNSYELGDFYLKAGYHSAKQIIHLLSFVHPGQFEFNRVYIVQKAVRFSILYYKIMNYNQRDNFQQEYEELFKKARSYLVQACQFSFSRPFYSYNIQLLDALVEKFHSEIK